MSEPALRVTETPEGVRFGWLAAERTQRAPVLLSFSATLEDSLANPDYAKVARTLASRGVVGVAVDLPCHGRERRPGEPGNGLAGWSQRLKGGENVVADLVARASGVLDFLIRRGIVDPGKIAACGTSRGGFAALHFAAADRRVGCVAAFAPVTDLLALAEFAGLEEHDWVRSLNLVNQAEALWDRRVWVCIGNHDQRVGTDLAIAFARSVWQAALARGGPAHVELHVTDVDGHRVHPTAHDEAASWLAACLSI